MTKAVKYFYAAILPICLIGAWFIVTNYGVAKPFFLPSPQAVWRSTVTLFMKDNFAKDMFISIIRIMLGFFAAALVSIPAGIALGINKKIEKAIEPTIDFIRYVPMPAYIPLLILWFGVGETEKIIVIAFGTFVQLVLMVASTVALVPKETIDFARVLGTSRRKIITHVILPHSWPKIIDDLRISMGWAWSGLMMAEIVGSSAGIGYAIIQSQRLLQTSEVFSAILVIGVLGLLTDLIFKFSQRVMFPWYKH